jgi:DNA-binding CsgD family transcriptional regulator
MEEAEFWDLFRTSRNPMVLVSGDRKLIEANAAMRALTHRSVKRSSGRPVLDFIVPDDRAHAEAIWKELELTGHALDSEHVRTVSGATIVFHYAAVETHLEEYGKCYLAVGIDASVNPDEEHMGNGAPSLTPREEEVVRLVAAGQTNDAIAHELALSPETIRTHVRNAMDKTGARNRAHLVAHHYARRLRT